MIIEPFREKLEAQNESMRKKDIGPIKRPKSTIKLLDEHIENVDKS